MIARMKNLLILLTILVCVREHGVKSDSPREPSIQAYGLPKRFSSKDFEPIDKIFTNEERVMDDWRSFRPRISIDNKRDVSSGVIELASEDSKPDFLRNVRSTEDKGREERSKDSIDETSLYDHRVLRPKVTFVDKRDASPGVIETDYLDTSEVPVWRSVRSADEKTEPESDLMMMESKVFRPLFVYRQQVASRKRRQGEKLHRPMTTRFDRRKPIYYDSIF